MRLQEACVRFNKLAGIRFEELFSQNDMNMIIINKGKTGQLLELALGMHLSSTNLDFDDGELKTNKCDNAGNPKETVFITQISSVIDELIQERPFEMFLPSIHIDLSSPRYAQLRDIWRSDYYSICRQLRMHIETSPDRRIHTSNGQHIQVRSKDSMPYHPIYSGVYGRYVSNKNHAFYFRKEFVYDIRSMSR